MKSGPGVGRNWTSVNGPVGAATPSNNPPALIFYFIIHLSFSLIVADGKL